MRVRPTPLLGTILAVGYIVLFVGLSYVFGGDITDIDSAEAIRPFVLSLASCAVTLIVVTTILGWWSPVLWERPRLTGWAWIAPALMAGLAVVQIATGGATSMDSERLTWTLILVALVGFSEEMAFRGLALVGFRGGTTEFRAFLGSTILFSLLHAPNVLLGTPIFLVPIQLVFSFIAGAALYLARRSLGTIVAAMIIHGMWDFATFAGPTGIMAASPFVFYVVVLVVLIVFRRQIFDTKVEATPATT